MTTGTSSEYCGRCGSENPAGNAFCNRCGVDLATCKTSPEDDTASNATLFAAGPALAPGAMIDGGRWIIEDVLGAGGMGTVYLARDEHARTVVVKTPHPDLLHQEGFSERFKAEIRSMMGIEHPHIVRVYDAGHEGVLPFFVVQYLPGGDLKQRILAGGGKQSPEQVTTWLRTIAEALDFTHSHDVIHRDVKPQNILFDDGGHAYLSDFGIAKAMVDGEASEMTKTGAFVGSVSYCAPEYVDRKFGPSCDQYSLAVVVYEALCGERPHKAATEERLLVDKVTQPAFSLAARKAGVPAKTCRVVMRALEQKPENRYASCVAFAEAFEASLASRSFSSSLSFNRSPQALRKRRRTRGPGPAVAVSLALVLALGVGLGVARYGGIGAADAPDHQSGGVEPARVAAAAEAAADESYAVAAAEVMAAARRSEALASAPPAVASPPPRAPLAAVKETRGIPAIPVVAPPTVDGIDTGIVVRSNVPGDTVSINGKIVGASGPTVRPVEAGPVTVVVRREGYAPFEQRIEVAPGMRPVVHATLTKIGATPAAPEMLGGPETELARRCNAGDEASCEFLGEFRRQAAKCRTGTALDCRQHATNYRVGAYGVSDRSDYARSLAEQASAGLQTECQQGVSRSCVVAGQDLEIGRGGLEQDRPQAVAMYRRACELGSTDGCAELDRLGEAR